MTGKRKLLFAKAVAALSAIPVLIYAYSTGPDPRKTGVPGESVCTECHRGTALNGGGGNVAVAFPGGLTYSPGVKQRLTVTITDSSARVHGFQLTARLSSDVRNGQAGRLDPIPGDSGVFVICSDGRSRTSAGGNCPASASIESIEHNTPRVGETFQVDWTPPASDQGPVQIFVAGNAANGDGTNNGDHIYAASYTLSPLAGGTSGGPTLAQVNPVVNGASFAPGIAPGSFLTIFGSNLAASTRSWDGAIGADLKLPTQIDGVSVTVDGKPAALAFMSPGQLNVLAPYEIGTGNVQVQVTTPQGSTTTTATAQTFAPAFFMFDPQNRQFVAALHGADNSIAAKAGLFSSVATAPAAPGEVIVLWGTGFGPTNPATPSLQVVTSPAEIDKTQLTITIGNVPAEVQFAGVTIAGVYQINVKVPDNVSGDVPIVAQVGGVQTQSSAQLTVQK